MDSDYIFQKIDIRNAWTVDALQDFLIDYEKKLTKNIRPTDI